MLKLKFFEMFWEWCRFAWNFSGIYNTTCSNWNGISVLMEWNWNLLKFKINSLEAFVISLNHSTSWLQFQCPGA